MTEEFIPPVLKWEENEVTHFRTPHRVYQKKDIWEHKAACQKCRTFNKCCTLDEMEENLILEHLDWFDIL